MQENVDHSVAGGWEKSLLFKILQLYVRVRMHSFAKDVKEKYKAKTDEMKKRSVRTELKKKDVSDK